MRISLQWLSEWIGGPLPAPKDLAARLTMAGLEVEGVEAAAPPLPGVVVGEIVERVKHPNADTLSVCQVSTGAGDRADRLRRAECARGPEGAARHRRREAAGRHGDQQAKLRGVESFGMLCSATRTRAVRRIERPARIAGGRADRGGARRRARLDDTILEVNLTPNRGDCMSVLGIAREVAALTGQALTGPALAAVPAASNDSFPVELDGGCGLRALRVARDPGPESAGASRPRGCRSACVAPACVRSARWSTSPTT